jgi:hypothetical protein
MGRLFRSFIIKVGVLMLTRGGDGGVERRDRVAPLGKERLNRSSEMDCGMAVCGFLC